MYSYQFSCSVLSDSLQLHARPPCPSATAGVYSNSGPLNQWCHPTISSSIVHFSSHLQSFLASWSFQMSQVFLSGGQNIGVSASISVLPMNIQDWLPLGWTSWISLQSKGLLRDFSNTTIQKHQFFGAQLSLQKKKLSHPYMTTGKTIALTRWTYVGKLLLFNMLFNILKICYLICCLIVITFLPRSKCLLISWQQSPAAVILEPPKKSLSLFPLFASICQEVMGPDAMILVFWMLSFKPTFSSPLPLSSRGS